MENNNDIFSPEYLDWVKQADLPPLTNSQHKFAEYLLKEKYLGNITDVFLSIRKWQIKN